MAAARDFRGILTGNVILDSQKTGREGLVQRRLRYKVGRCVRELNTRNGCLCYWMPGCGKQAGERLKNRVNLLFYPTILETEITTRQFWTPMISTLSNMTTNSFPVVRYISLK